MVKQDGSFVSGCWCIAKAIFLPHPMKCAVVSHLLMAWKVGNVISGMSNIGIGIMDWIIAVHSPFLKSTQSVESRRTVEKKHNFMTRTTISLSTVRT